MKGLSAGLWFYAAVLTHTFLKKKNFPLHFFFCSLLCRHLQLCNNWRPKYSASLRLQLFRMTFFEKLYKEEKADVRYFYVQVQRLVGKATLIYFTHRLGKSDQMSCSEEFKVSLTHLFVFAWFRVTIVMQSKRMWCRHHSLFSLALSRCDCNRMYWNVKAISGYYTEVNTRNEKNRRRRRRSS